MPKDALQDAITDFVARVRAITREETLDAMRAVLGGDRVPSPRAGRQASTRTPRRSKGTKRDPKVLAALVTRLAGEIKSKPGRRVEQIGASLRVPTKELALPIRKLLAGRKIRKTGTRRATKYFAV